MGSVKVTLLNIIYTEPLSMVTPVKSMRSGTANSCSTFVHNASRSRGSEMSVVKDNESDPKRSAMVPFQASHSFNRAEEIIQEFVEKKSIGIEVPLYGDNNNDSLLDRREDETYLYNIPHSISPTYRALPKPLQLGIWLLAAAISSRKAWINGLTQIKIIRTLLMVLFRGLLASVLVQDLFFSPSRIDTNTILSKKWLPSPLSKFSNVTSTIPTTLINPNDKNYINDKLQVGPLGVHFLEYVNTEIMKENCTEQYHFDAIHFNHGFGASSLSWLPAIPSLTNRLKAKVSVAHDAPGFGFTARSPTFGVRDGLIPYSAAGSAALGNILLLNRIAATPFDSKEKKEMLSSQQKQDLKRVCLFGHSMGCAATLRMALTLPQNVQKTVVLVAPALVGSFPKSENSSSGLESKTLEKSRVKTTISWILSLQPVKFRALIATFISCVRQVILDVPLKYILRRLVG